MQTNITESPSANLYHSAFVTEHSMFPDGTLLMNDFFPVQWTEHTKIMGKVKERVPYKASQFGISPNACS
jgi:hypothetical protein